MEKIKTSICIIGGGPAGATTSLFLSKYKIPHVLLEKDIFPREKVCGEAYDGRVFNNLNRLNPNYVEEMQDLGIIEKTWRYSLNTQKAHFSIAFDQSKTPKLLTYRPKFDQFLLQKAKASPYAQIFENQKVVNTQLQKQSIVIQSKDFEIEADFGILAAGSNSNFSFSEDKNTYLFFRSYFKNLEPKKDKEVEIYLLKKKFDGVLLISPAGAELYNVMVGIKKQQFKKNKLNGKTIYQLALQEFPAVSKRIDCATQIDKPKGTSMNFSNTHLNYKINDRLLNIGASAYTINPITGAGVGNAMTMARLVADSIKEHLENPNMNELIVKSYHLKAYHALNSIMRTNRIVSFIMNYPKLTELLIGLAANSKMVRAIINDHQSLSKIGRPFYIISSMMKALFKPNNRQIPSMETKS